MALKSYVLTADFRAPYVVATGHPKNPQQIKTKIETLGVPLKNWDVKINYGIKTGTENGKKGKKGKKGNK